MAEGTVKNAFSYTLENADYYSNVTKTEGDLFITPATLAITTESATKTYDGTALTAPGTVTGYKNNETADFTVTGSQTEVGGEEGNNTYAIAFKGEEGASEIATAVRSDYTISENLGTLTVTKAALTITAKDQTYTYNGAAQGEDSATYTDTSKVTVEGLQGSDALTSVTLNGQETNVGEYAGKIVPSAAAIGEATGNYDITYVAGKLTITKAALTITADSNSKVYDSTPLTDDGWQDTAPVGLQGQDTVDTVTVEGSQRLVGKSGNVASDAVVKNANDEDVTGNYEIKYVDGTLTVTDGSGQGEEPVDDSLVVTKSHKAGEYDLNEVVTFTITATNIYATQQTITLSEIPGVTLADTEFANVAPGVTVETTATYTMTEADILAGKFDNTVTAAVGNIEKTAKDTVTAAALNTEMTVNKTIDTSNTPANGEAYTLGEVIEYVITVINNGNVTYSNVVVTDELEGAKIVAGEGYDVNPNGTATIGSLAIGATVNVIVRYVVTEADILAGSVTNKATAVGDEIQDPKDPENPKTPSGEDEITTGDEDDPDGPTPPITDTNPHLTVTKASNLATGETASLGQTITYTITVKNDGNLTVSNIELTDTVEGYPAADITANLDKTRLVPGETATATFTHVVNEQDILAGSVKNTATATGDNQSDDPTGDEPGTKEDPTDKPNPHLTVTKASNVATGETASLGQTITYMITVKNDGNLTVSNIKLTDTVEGYTAADITANLDKTTLVPGETATATFTHVVNEQDILAGSVKNTATATGDNPSDDHPTGVEPGTKEDPTDEPNPHLTTVKDIRSAPANGTTYGTGETVRYMITVTNDGNMTLSDVRVSDQLTGATGTPVIVSAAGAGYTVSGSIASITSLAPGDTVTILVNYTVLVTDAGASITNAAIASGNSPSNPNSPTTGTDTTDPVNVTPAPVPATPAAAVPTAPAAVPAAAAAPTPAAPAATPIANNPTPQAQTINDDGNALGEGEGSWSLFDLIATIVTTILAAIMLIFAFGRNRKDGEEDEQTGEQEPDEIYKRKRLGRVLSVIPAVGAIVLFVLTQDLTQPMAIFDSWSLVFGIIGIINIVLAIVTRKKTKDDEDDEQQQTPQTGFVPAGPASL